jgi:hypothetical protein
MKLTVDNYTVILKFVSPGRNLNAISESSFLWITCNLFVSQAPILVAVLCEFSCTSARQSYRASAMKRTDRWDTVTECQGCAKQFVSMYAFDHHRSSPFLRGTACYAMPDEKRITVTAAPRSNISTAALERRLTKRTRGRGRSRHIKHIL